MAGTAAVGAVPAAPAPLLSLAPLDLLPHELLPSRYTFVRNVGYGATATVSEAIDTETKKTVAIKVIASVNVDEKMQQEIEVLTRVDHSNCIRLLRVEKTPTHTLLVMEFCSGGDLFSKVKQNGAISEANAREIARSLFDAVARMHSMGIMHRDLKPENILLAKARGFDVKIADFGLATVGSKAHGACGTLRYMAPEVCKGLKDGYSDAVDCWSLGVVLHVIMLGFLPYNFKDHHELADFVDGKSPVKLFESDECSHLSPEAKDLIRKLLTVDPSQRLSAKDALTHPWVVGTDAVTRPTKRKVALKEVAPTEREATATVGSHSKKMKPSFESLFFNSPDCPSSLPLGPRCMSLDTLELTPSSSTLELTPSSSSTHVSGFVRPEGQLFA